MRRVERTAGGGGADVDAGSRRAGVRVFRRQALARYAAPAASHAGPPEDRPHAFVGLWLLVSVLVATGLLLASMLAADLGGLDGGTLRGAPGAAAPDGRRGSGV